MSNPMRASPPNTITLGRVLTCILRGHTPSINSCPRYEGARQFRMSWNLQSGSTGSRLARWKLWTQQTRNSKWRAKAHGTPIQPPNPGLKELRNSDQLEAQNQTGHCHHLTTESLKPRAWPTVLNVCPCLSALHTLHKCEMPRKLRHRLNDSS